MKNRILSLGLLIIMAAACRIEPRTTQNAPAENPAAQIVVDRIILPGVRVGVITGRSTPGQIKEAYGKNQVVENPFYIGEGEEQPGLIVFPDSPDKLEIALGADGTVEFIRISNDDSPWSTENGIKIGMELRELQQINGSPFAFYGFEWDFSGLVADWENGTLTPNLIVALIPGNEKPLSPELMGDKLLSSENALLKNYDIKIGSIVVTFEE